MPEIEKIKQAINQNMHRLCAHCASGNASHSCPLQKIFREVSSLQGVPLMVNGEFRGMIISSAVS
jgi:hypothetical protein